MSRTTFAIPTHALETFSSSTERFYTDYRNLQGNNAKRQKAMNVIRCGHIMEAAGLEKLLALIDTEDFFAADENIRKNMIMRVLSLANFDNISATPFPPAEPETTNVKMESAKKEVNQAAFSTNHSTVTQPENPASIIREDDGVTRIIERAPQSKKPPLSVMNVLSGNVPKK